jgi:hypothetical protein
VKRQAKTPADPAAAASTMLGHHPNEAPILRLLAALDCIGEASKALASGFPPAHERALEPIRWAHSVLGELVKDLSPKPAVKVARKRRIRRRVKAAAPRATTKPLL